MQTEVSDLSEFASLSESLNTGSIQLNDSVGNMDSIISQAQDFDGIDVTTAANVLRNNLKNIANDMKNVTKNVADYLTGLSILDMDDFTTEEDVFSLSNMSNNVNESITTNVPEETLINNNETYTN